MMTEKKKPKDQIFLEELIGSKFPVSSFESDIKNPATDIYRYEIPGGQYTNLQPQVVSLENTAKNYGLATFHAKSKWAMLRIRLITDAALSLQKRKICFALYWNTKAKWYM